MSEGQESTLKVDQSITQKTGLLLDTPKLIQDARILSKRSTINIIQILYSKIQGYEQVSWWSTSALRQKTLYSTVRIRDILDDLTHIGLVEQVKIKNIVSYSLTKRPFHGIILVNENKTNRRRYLRDQYCYRINADYIELVFSSHNNRTIFIPAENMHLENLKLLEIILKHRTMIVLQAMGNKRTPIHTNQIQNYLNIFLERTSGEKKVEYNLSNLRLLTKHSFVDNIGAVITSNHKKYNDTWTIINRDTIQKKDKNYSMLYSLNFDRIRIQFTDRIGQDFLKNSNSFEITFPDREDISSTDQKVMDHIQTHGVVVDII